MTCHKYVVTAQKPTATHFAVKGSFTSPHETNLILGYNKIYKLYESFKQKIIIAFRLFNIVKGLV